MRYTKYQYKKKKSGISFITSMIMLLVAAGAIGLLLAKVAINFIPIGEKVPPPEGAIESNVPVVDDGNQEVAKGEAIFTAVQCGYFSKQENATQIVEKIGKEHNAFIVEDNSKFKVSAGVFTEENSNKVVEDLTAKEIENAKIKFVLNKEDEVQNQIATISEGYLDILNTLNDKEVVSVNTNDFKTWTKELPSISEGEHKDSLNEFKSHIEALPEEIKKENVVEEMKYLYTVLERFKK